MAAAGKSLPIGAEGDRCYPIGVPLKGLQCGITRSMPEPYLAGRRSCHQQISLRAKHHSKNTSEGIGKHRCRQIGVGKIDLLQNHPLEVGLPNHQMREIVSAQRTPHLNQYIQHVACGITGALVAPFAQGSKETLEPLLERPLPEDGKQPLHKRQQNEATLTLPEIVFGLCQEQGMTLKEH